MRKVTLRGLRANVVRFALTALAVIIGVSFLTGTRVLTATISNVFDQLFANIYDGTDVVVRAHEAIKSDFGAGERPRVPESLLTEVRKAPGVRAAEGNLQFYAQISFNDKEIGNPGQGPPTLGFNWTDDEQLNTFTLEPGSKAPATADEVVIDKNSAEEGGIKVGDTVTILSPQKPKDFKVTGIVVFGSANSLAGASASLFTLDEAQRLAPAKNEFDQISVAGKDGLSQTELQKSVSTYLAANGNAQSEVATGDEVVKENQDAVQKQLGFLNLFLTGFAVIALIVGIFIIYNTFSIVVAQRTKELALLRALGASRRQILTEVFTESAVVGFVASALGVLVGIALALGLKALMAAFGFDLPSTGVVVQPSAVIIGMVVGVFFTMVSSIAPAVQATNIPPVAAMRDVQLERPPNRPLRFGVGGGLMVIGIATLFFALYGDIDNALVVVLVGMGLTFAGAFILGALFARPTSRIVGAPIAAVRGITGRLAKENAARSPKRTATTATALLIGVALVAMIAVLSASVKESFGRAIDNSFKTDFIVQYPTFGPGAGLSPELAANIAKLPEIQNSSGIRLGNIEVNGSLQGLGAIDASQAQALLALGDVEGSFSGIDKPGTIAVSKKYAEDHGLKVGDTLPVKFTKTGVQNFEIVDLYSERNFGDFWVSLETYEKNFDQQLDFLVFAKLVPGVTAAQGKAAIEPLLKDYPTAKLQDNAQFKADQQAQVDQFLGLVFVLLLLALVTAVVGIANTLALSIHERTRELGLLRAVGSQRRQVRSMIRWESVIIALLGVVNGLAIGIFFGWAFVTALKDQGFSTFVVPVPLLIIVVIILLIASLFAALFPARRASKLNILRAISSE
jgi:putative ABC transport system permease protein